MGKKAVVLMPGTSEIVKTMGEQIKMARLRRQISATLSAQRAGISRATLCAVEKGSPSVSIGIYAAVLHSLSGMDKDLLLVAKDDQLGRTLQDLKLTVRKRAPKKKGNKDGRP
jgi:transcriptional regulator with XRE-family HTH domain